jgi:thiamine-phosphate pyrophosphorylase
MRPPFDLSLYLVTDRPLCLGRSLVEVVKEAVAGGVSMVQLREKEATTKEFVELALALKKHLAPLNVPLIINDRIDVALAVDSDGIHIGQGDMPYTMARRLMGPDKLIGLSVESYEQALEANQLDVDYIGISPVYTTSTKQELEQGLGLKETTRIARASVHPSVAIGGINLTTAKEVLETGVNGLSVVSVICSAPSPKEVSRELQTLIKRYI